MMIEKMNTLGSESHFWLDLANVSSKVSGSHILDVANFSIKTPIDRILKSERKIDTD